jgi:hypothetical protein
VSVERLPVEFRGYVVAVERLDYAVLGKVLCAEIFAPGDHMESGVVNRAFDLIRANRDAIRNGGAPIR